MIVFVGGEENDPAPTVDAVSFNSVSMTQIGSIVREPVSGSFSNNITAWYLNETDIPTGGSYTLSMSFSNLDTDADWDYLHWCVFVFDDADQGGFTTSEYDTQTVGSSDTLTFSPGVSVSNGDYVCISGNTGTNATITTMTGYTYVDETMGGAGFYSAEKTITGSGTETPSIVLDASETRFTGFMVNVLDFAAVASFNYPLFARQLSYRKNGQYL
jgi:hypothetical protein